MYLHASFLTILVSAWFPGIKWKKNKKYEKIKKKHMNHIKERKGKESPFSVTASRTDGGLRAVNWFIELASYF